MSLPGQPGSVTWLSLPIKVRIAPSFEEADPDEEVRSAGTFGPVALASAGMTTSVLWFRRDLRLADHPALLAARDDADDVLPLFVLDDALRGPAGAPRLAFLYRCLRELEERTDGRLRVLAGRPEDVVARVAREVSATGVHVSSDHGPYGRARDERVREALGGVPLVATGSPYGVTPGTLTKDDGTPYRMYTPFARAWRSRGVHSPARTPRAVPWTDGGLPADGVPADPPLGDVVLPPAGELAARARWREFLDGDVEAYAERRDLPPSTAPRCCRRT